MELQIDVDIQQDNRKYQHLPVADTTAHFNKVRGVLLS